MSDDPPPPPPPPSPFSSSLLTRCSRYYSNQAWRNWAPLACQWSISHISSFGLNGFSFHRLISFWTCFKYLSLSWLRSRGMASRTALFGWLACHGSGIQAWVEFLKGMVLMVQSLQLIQAVMAIVVILCVSQWHDLRISHSSYNTNNHSNKAHLCSKQYAISGLHRSRQPSEPHCTVGVRRSRKVKYPKPQMWRWIVICCLSSLICVSTELLYRCAQSFSYLEMKKVKARCIVAEQLVENRLNEYSKEATQDPLRKI